MANYKRKKMKRAPYVGYKNAVGKGENTSDYRRRTTGTLELDSRPATRGSRPNRRKHWIVRATYTGGNRLSKSDGDWIVCGRYATEKSARSALTSLQKKQWLGEYYSFQVSLA